MLMPVQIAPRAAVFVFVANANIPTPDGFGIRRTNTHTENSHDAMENRHPVNELAEIRAERRRLTTRETALRVEGKDYRAKSRR